MNASFVDNVIRDNLLELKACLDKQGELGCFYSANPKDGKMEVRYYIQPASLGLKRKAVLLVQIYILLF